MSYFKLTVALIVRDDIRLISFDTDEWITKDGCLHFDHPEGPSRSLHIPLNSIVYFVSEDQ